jgi:hypothetical protein
MKGEFLTVFNRVAFYRRRSGERLVPMTETHRGTMAKLYSATCIIEVPYRIRKA